MAAAELRNTDANRAQLLGDLLNTTVVAVVDAGKQQITQADSRWTLDMSGVERVSSAGVALILEWLRTAQQNNIELRIENLPPHMRPILEISDLEPLFEPLLA